MRKLLAGLLAAVLILLQTGAAVPALAEEEAPPAPVVVEPEPAAPPAPSEPEPPAPVEPPTPAEPDPPEPATPEEPDPSTPAEPEETAEPGESQPPTEGDTPAPDETDAPGDDPSPSPEVDPDPSREPDDPDETDEPEETQEPEATPEPDPAVITALSASVGTTLVGRPVCFSFSVQNAAGLVYRLSGPRGAAGDMPIDAASYTFTPDTAGVYTFELTARGPDGSSVSASTSVSVIDAPELSVDIESDQRSGFAGDPVSFRLTLRNEAELAGCSIEVTHAGKTVFSSKEFTDTVTATLSGTRRVADCTITVTVTDIYDQTATRSLSIPCAVHSDESAADWERSVRRARLTGVWPEDLIAVARTQLGYTESSTDFIIRDDGSRQGYTRYGAWMAFPYEEWCGMFVSFCLSYAGIPSSAFPYEGNCQRWIEALRVKDLYAPRGTVVPQVGDIVLFDYEADNYSDHVGIICEVVRDKEGVPVRIVTIEGNHRASVATGMTYSLSDGRIAGYGLLNEAYYRKIGRQYREVTVATDAYSVTAGIDPECNIPTDADMRVVEIERGDARYDALVDQVNTCLAEQEAGMLNYARFMTIAFMNADGEAIVPEAPVRISVTYPERVLSGSRLRPALLTVKDDVIDVSDEITLERQTVDGKVASRFAFEASQMPVTVGTAVAADLKFRTARSEALRGRADGLTVTLKCEEEARIPEATGLDAQELLPGDADYDFYMAQLGKVLEGASAENARLFRVNALLNGMKVRPAAPVALTISCRQTGDAARVARLTDGAVVESECQRRKTRLEVAFDTDAFGVFGIVYADEEE